MQNVNFNLSSDIFPCEIELAAGQMTELLYLHVPLIRYQLLLGPVFTHSCSDPHPVFGPGHFIRLVLIHFLKSMIPLPGCFLLMETQFVVFVEFFY